MFGVYAFSEQDEPMFVGFSGFMTSIPSILLIFVIGAESDSDVDPVCYDFV